MVGMARLPSIAELARADFCPRGWGVDAAARTRSLLRCIMSAFGGKADIEAGSIKRRDHGPRQRAGPAHHHFPSAQADLGYSLTLRRGWPPPPLRSFRRFASPRRCGRAAPVRLWRRSLGACPEPSTGHPWRRLFAPRHSRRLRGPKNRPKPCRLQYVRNHSRRASALADSRSATPLEPIALPWR